MAAASTLTLAACQSSSTVSDEAVAAKPADGRNGVVVTGNKREPSARDAAVPVQAITSEQAYARLLYPSDACHEQRGGASRGPLTLKNTTTYRTM